MFYEKSKPHFTPLAHSVRGRAEIGYMTHHTLGNTYQYYPVIRDESWRKGTLRNVISKYFNDSLFSAFSSLVKEEDISIEDLKKLIDDVEKGKESE